MNNNHIEKGRPLSMAGLKKIMQAYSKSFLLTSVCEIGLINYISNNNGTTLESLADGLNINSELIYRILRPLICMGIIEKVENMYFLSHLGEEMSAKHIQDIFIMNRREGVPNWNMLTDSLLNDAPSYVLLKGISPFEDHAKNQDVYDQFNSSMNYSSINLSLDSFFEDNTLANHKTIVDIGGGSGAITIRFLKQYKHLNGYILDLEHVKEVADKNINKNNLLNRCSFITNDFFKNINMKGDLYILSRVLHDWDDDKAMIILENTITKMEKGNKLFIIDKILPEKDFNISDTELFMDDLNVWLMCGGKERTFNDFQKLINRCGGHIVRKYNLSGHKAILEIEKGGVKNC